MKHCMYNYTTLIWPTEIVVRKDSIRKIFSFPLLKFVTTSFGSQRLKNFSAHWQRGVVKLFSHSYSRFRLVLESSKWLLGCFEQAFRAKGSLQVQLLDDFLMFSAASPLARVGSQQQKQGSLRHPFADAGRLFATTSSRTNEPLLLWESSVRDFAFLSPLQNKEDLLNPMIQDYYTWMLNSVF